MSSTGLPVTPPGLRQRGGHIPCWSKSALRPSSAAVCPTALTSPGKPRFADPAGLLATGIPPRAVGPSILGTREIREFALDGEVSPPLVADRVHWRRATRCCAQQVVDTIASDPEIKLGRPSCFIGGRRRGSIRSCDLWLEWTLSHSRRGSSHRYDLFGRPGQMLSTMLKRRRGPLAGGFRAGGFRRYSPDNRTDRVASQPPQTRIRDCDCNRWLFRVGSRAVLRSPFPGCGNCDRSGSDTVSVEDAVRPSGGTNHWDEGSK